MVQFMQLLNQLQKLLQWEVIIIIFVFHSKNIFEKLLTNPTTGGKPTAALLGAYRVQNALKLPSIGGKDSMSGSFEDLHVPPTLVSFAVTSSDVDDIMTPKLKKLDMY